MANNEWEKVKEALRKPATPEAMREAAEAFAQYRQVSLGKRNSRPTLVSLGKEKPYPTSIPLEKIPEQLEKNPAFFELMKRVVTKEK